MRSGRFLDLYIAETREHLQLLTRSVLALERGDRSAIEEAFRAAHTIKGLAAAMGHVAAAEAAHRLEDRLGGVREGGAVNAAVTDGLLLAVDGLESAIHSALAGDDPEAVDALEAGAGGDRGLAEAPAPPAASVPDGTVHSLVVRLSPDAVLPQARAELIRKAVASCAGVLGTWPATGDPFGGTLHIFLGAGADPAAVESAARSAGEVASVAWAAATAATGAGGTAAAPAERVAARAAASVRVDRSRLDEMAEAIAELSVLLARAAQEPDQLTSHRASAVLASLQRMILDLRMVPVSSATDRIARLVRDASRAAGKEVDFEAVGSDIELDQAVLDALVDPLVHLLRNAVDHGIENPAERQAAGKPARGLIRIETVRERNGIRMLVIDNGRGVDTDAVAERGRALGLLAETSTPGEDEILRLMFQPGFSTASAVTELSGRGVGLDVVAGRIRGLGGAIDVATRRGAGTTFTLRVPVTLALSHSLRIGLGAEEYALPITHVKEIVPLAGENGDAATRGVVTVREEAVSLVDLGRVLGAGTGSPAAAVVAELGERRVALAVDRVIGHEQILVKPFDAPVGTLPVFSGATILPDGRPALLIDPLSVL